MKTRPPKPKKEVWTGKPATTENGRRIQDLMRENKIKGNHKDFVVIAGNRMIDANGSYTIQTPDGRPVHANVVALVAKRELHRLLGAAADAFWNRKLNRRTPPPPTETTLKPGEEVRLC